MYFIDTHAHLYLDEFNHDIQDVISQALEQGVNAILMPAIDSSHHIRLMDLYGKYPDYLLPMAGLHPCSVNKEYKHELQFVQERLLEGTYVGIGETGIDLYWDKTFLKEQMKAFETQIAWSLEYDLPIIIHQRDSFDEIFTVLNNFSSANLKGIFHCYAGNVAQAEKCTQMGFKLGIGGVVTFKKSLMAEVVKELPLEELVLETDAPYLSPSPYRGKRNEPAYITLTAHEIARIKNIDVEEVAETTSGNAAQMFHLDL